MSLGVLVLALQAAHSLVCSENKRYSFATHQIKDGFQGVESLLYLVGTLSPQHRV